MKNELRTYRPNFLTFALLLAAVHLILPSLLAQTAFGKIVSPGQSKPRLLVLTDIGGDPDDMQSMRRLMLYANEFEIVGLIASASGIPGELHREVTRPDLIQAILDDYEQVRDNLALHAEGYPPTASLRRIVKSGSPLRGVGELGPGKDTEGSRHIISTVDSGPGQFHVLIWGGAHDLAQALHDISASRGAEQVSEFISKLRVYAVADQDAWGGDRGTGAWIREHFPRVRYVETGPTGMNRFTALFRGMYHNDSKGGDHPVIQLVPNEVIALNQQAWVDAHVRHGHGPLGAGYPLVRQNPSSDNNTVGVKEGETPSWFFLLPNGLSDPEHPNWGGWGGRFKRQAAGYFVDAEDDHWSGSTDSAVRRKWTVARWRQAFQNDFAARMDWCVKPYDRANHNPRGVIDGNHSKSVLKRTAVAGDSIRLDASQSWDPDENSLSYRWFVYAEASVCEGPVSIAPADRPLVVLKVRRDSACNTIHVVLEVTDDGDPALSSYRRVVVQVR